MKLWQHSKGSQCSPQVEAFTVGKDPELDLGLLPYDVAGSVAHAKVLVKAGILTQDECGKLVAALEAIDLEAFAIAQSQEDVHTALEEHLTEELGLLGKKIHTGRSRNDQVATALALYMKDHLVKVETTATALAKLLLNLAKQHDQTPLPGYTHMQQAMVSTVGLWAASYVELLSHDLALLKATKKVLDTSPLGTAAGYGPSITLDREYAATLLGFSAPIITAPAAQGLRGKNEAVALFALQQVMATIGKLATDLLLFTTKEFGYFSIAPELCTGSSIMPQKKNPDVLELLRAKSCVVAAKLNEAILISQGLPSGYNRDFQLLKEPLFEGFAITEQSIAMMSTVIEGLQVNEEKILAAFSPEIIAADKATALVKQGMPFREAYQKVAAELEKLGPLTKEQLLENIAAKKTLGAPGNSGIDLVRKTLIR